MQSSSQPSLQAPTLPEIASHLLEDPTFISQLRKKLAEPLSIPQQEYDTIIEQLSELITLIIHRKLQHEMQTLIADNNSILEQIKNSIEKGSSRISEVSGSVQGKEGKDASFTEIHNMISEEKKKIFQQFSDGETSMLEQYDSVVERIAEIQRKIKTMEDKYETNFKSLWNVLSMTESAVFDYIRDNKLKQKQKEKQKNDENNSQKKDKSIFNFWKGVG